MKPPIEYRPKPKTAQLRKLREQRDAKLDHLKEEALRAIASGSMDIHNPEHRAKLALDSVAVGQTYAESVFIVIRRDRAKYNAYMRAYRAKKKVAKP